MVFLSIWSRETYGYMKCKDIGNLKHSYHNTPVGVDSSICLVGVWTCGNNLQDLTGFIGKTSRHQIASDRTVLCNGSLQPEAKTWITWSINPVADHVWGVFSLEFSLRFVEYVQKRQWNTTERLGVCDRWCYARKKSARCCEVLCSSVASLYSLRMVRRLKARARLV